MSAYVDPIPALAAMLGVELYQLTLAAGSLRRAHELAAGVAAGLVTLAEARSDLGVDDEGRPTRSRVLPAND